MTDRKLSYVKFAHPVWVDGLGMVDQLDIRLDADTRKPKNAGVTLTWLCEERVLRVSTSAGETLLSAACSMKPVYEDRAAAAAKAKK